MAQSTISAIGLTLRCDDHGVIFPVISLSSRHQEFVDRGLLRHQTVVDIGWNASRYGTMLFGREEI